MEFGFLRLFNGIQVVDGARSFGIASANMLLVAELQDGLKKRTPEGGSAIKTYFRSDLAIVVTIVTENHPCTFPEPGTCYKS